METTIEDAEGASPKTSVGIDSVCGELSIHAVFRERGLRKRPYLTKEMCIRVIEDPIRMELQENNRFRFWAVVPELGGRYLRVITLADKMTIHNAFPDRRFTP